VPEWLQSILANVALIKSSRILFLLIVAILSRLIIHKLIDRSVQQSIRRPLKLRAAVALQSASGLPAQRRSQRIQALGSLAKSITTVVIVIVTLVAVLAELGFNVTTIVAGTSVVAAAIAFGTQSIVKDLLSGIFLLVEDQLGVGDYVDMQLASGTVEEIGLRVTTLRADDGTLWYVRNGEVLRLANFSKGGPDRPVAAEQTIGVRMLEPEPAMEPDMQPAGDDADSSDQDS
jgi:small-conductance mechanosensitive channel